MHSCLLLNLIILDKRGCVSDSLFCGRFEFVGRSSCSLLYFRFICLRFEFEGMLFCSLHYFRFPCLFKIEICVYINTMKTMKLAGLCCKLRLIIISSLTSVSLECESGYWSWEETPDHLLSSGENSIPYLLMTKTIYRKRLSCTCLESPFQLLKTIA